MPIIDCIILVFHSVKPFSIFNIPQQEKHMISSFSHLPIYKTLVRVTKIRQAFVTLICHSMKRQLIKIIFQNNYYFYKKQKCTKDKH